MALYTLDEGSIVGEDAIDDAHRKIADLSQAIKGLVEGGGSFDEVHDNFRQLAKVMRDHFEIEETLLESLDASTEVSVHIARHKQNHKFFRETLTYAEDKFVEKAASQEIPNVVGLIPDQYIEELKDLDAKMTDLFAKYGRDSDTTS
ncbi:hemerythrin domain-containing protein [Pseudomonadota bacterium]